MLPRRGPHWRRSTNTDNGARRRLAVTTYRYTQTYIQSGAGGERNRVSTDSEGNVQSEEWKSTTLYGRQKHLNIRDEDVYNAHFHLLTAIRFRYRIVNRSTVLKFMNTKIMRTFENIFIEISYDHLNAHL